MELTFTLLLTCLIFAYVIPAYKRYKGNRYWREDKIAKRIDLEQQQRIAQVYDWYNELAKKYQKEWAEARLLKDTTSV